MRRDCPQRPLYEYPDAVESIYVVSFSNGTETESDTKWTLDHHFEAIGERPLPLDLLSFRHDYTPALTWEKARHSI